MAKTLTERIADSNVDSIISDLNSCRELLDSCETDAGLMGLLHAMQFIAAKLDTVISGVVADNE